MKAILTSFTKEWGTGAPLKPSSKEYTGTAAEIKTALDSDLDNLSLMQSGEVVSIIIEV